MSEQATATQPTTIDPVKAFVQNFGKDAAKPATVQPVDNPVPTPAAQANNQPAPQDDKFASKFAALSRRERGVLERETALKEAEKTYQDYLETKKQARVNPLKALEALGLSVDDVVQHALTGKPDERRVLEDYEKRIKDAEESSRKRVEELEKKLQQRDVDAYRYSAIEKIKAAGETYEILNKGGNYGLVFEIIQEWHDSDDHKGEILPLEKAAEMAENYYEKEISEKFKGTKKLRKLLGFEEEVQAAPQAPHEKAVPSQAADAIAQVTGKTNTLTNNLTASGSVPKDDKDLTDDERFERAKAILQKSFAK